MKSTIVNIVVMNVNLSAFKLKVSNSLNLNLAVLSKTIIANASIARLLRNTSGNCMSGAFLYSICPKNIPASMSNSTSGIFSLFPTQEHITPTKSRTAIAVVIINASCIVRHLSGVFINFYHY